MYSFRPGKFTPTITPTFLSGLALGMLLVVTWQAT